MHGLFFHPKVQQLCHYFRQTPVIRIFWALTDVRLLTSSNMFYILTIIKPIYLCFDGKKSNNTDRQNNKPWYKRGFTFTSVIFLCYMVSGFFSCKPNQKTQISNSLFSKVSITMFMVECGWIIACIITFLGAFTQLFLSSI